MRVWRVFNLNIRGKNVALPEGYSSSISGEVPDLATSDAVVVKPFPRILPLLKTVFQEQNFSAVYFKMTLTRPTAWTG